MHGLMREGRVKPALYSTLMFLGSTLPLCSFVGGGLRRSQGVRNQREYEAYDERILGSGEFVESLWREEESGEINGSKISLEEMMQRAADTLEVKVELLQQKNRTKELADVRAAICYLAVRVCNFSGVAVARALNMTRSGVSVAVKRGGEIVSRNPALRDKLVDYRMSPHDP